MIHSLATLSADDLRHLAAALERRQPQLQKRRQLGQQGAGELADMLLERRVPTSGWWRRRLPQRVVPAPYEPSPDEIAAVLAEFQGSAK